MAVAALGRDGCSIQGLKAAGVGKKELRQVAAEFWSGPEGKVDVERRVAEANVGVAATLCDCAVCEEATTKIGGQSRLQRVRTVDAVVEQQVGQQAAATGDSKAGLYGTQTR